MTKTANIFVRIEPSLKEGAEAVLNNLGLTPSNAINLFYKQIILHQGLPFEIKIPTKTKKDTDDTKI